MGKRNVSGYYHAISLRALSVFVLTAAMAPAVLGQLSFGNAENFNSGWKFELCRDSITPSEVEFDDSSWRGLSLPHDWSVESRPSPSLYSCTGYFPGGMGWYRKHFTVSDNMPAHYLCFEGVYNRSEVYVNGTLVGKRPNGYVSFYYDITPYLRPGDNVVAVKVDHTREADSRWYTGSGIYRDVYLISSGETHLSPWGLGWKAKSITPSKALVEVEYSVDIKSGTKGLAAEVFIKNHEGKIVAKGRRALSGNTGKMTLGISKPRLWDIDSPYLYSLELNLLENGKRIDYASCNLGLRTLEFDPDKGFSLNGRNRKVKGVCLHHDAGVLGAVVPRQVWKRRLQQLKSIGVNAIRMSHNPQAPAVYDLCDELGLLVMDEASDEWEFPKRKWLEGWNKGTPGFEGSFDFFEEWIERDVADMVRRDRNHPCVAFWSIGNEVDYPNDPYSHPILDNASINQQNYGGYDPKAPSAMRIGEIAMRLAPIVRAIDDSRPVTGALAGVVMSNQTSYPDAVDIVGYNYTEDRYHTDHELYPKRVIYGSENGQGYKQWLAVRDNDHIFGQFLWTGTDYLGEAGAWPSRGLGTGLLDFGSFVKPRGKFRAALWREDPVAYLGTYKRGEADPGLWIDAQGVWNYEDGDFVRVVCYTNAHSARLLLDGAEIGAVKPYNDTEGIIHWDIPYSPGRLSVEAMDADGKVIARDELLTTGHPFALRATTDTDILDPDNPLAHVTVEVVDKDGNLVPLADNMVSCHLTGDASLLGVEGTGNHDMSHPRDRSRRVCNGRLLAYVSRNNTAGEVKLRFASPMLKSTEITLTTK